MRPVALVGVVTSLWMAAVQAEPTLPRGDAEPRWNVSMQLRQPTQGPMQVRAQPRAWQLHDELLQRETDTARLTIEFKPRSATADLRDLGTVRVQLSSQGSFSLRPRRGGVQMSWKASF